MKRIVGVFCALGLLAGCSSSGGTTSSGPNSSAKFVTAISQDAGAAASDATALIAEANTDLSAGGLPDLTQLAADAQSLHGHLTDFRSQILGTADVGNAVQMDFVSAENDLKNACGSLNTFTGSLSAKDNAAWQTQMASAIAEWNQDVNAIWTTAGVTPAPTITVPSS